MGRLLFLDEMKSIAVLSQGSDISEQPVWLLLTFTSFFLEEMILELALEYKKEFAR